MHPLFNVLTSLFILLNLSSMLFLLDSQGKENYPVKLLCLLFFALECSMKAYVFGLETYL